MFNILTTAATIFWVVLFIEFILVIIYYAFGGVTLFVFGLAVFAIIIGLAKAAKDDMENSNK